MSPVRRAKVLSVRTRGDLDDDCTLSLRYNGYSFHVFITPERFTNSPDLKVKYLKYLKAIHPMGSGEFEDISEEDVFNWVIDNCQSLFNELAPLCSPSFDPGKIRKMEAKPVLSEYLFPRTFGCTLEAVNETLLPRHIDDYGRCVPPRTFLDGDFLDELEGWATLFDPSTVHVAFSDPDHALDRMPSRVMVEERSGEKRVCYFKGFEAGAPGGPLQRELEVYKKINSQISEDVPIGRLVGVAHETTSDATLGLLLHYVDCKGTLDDELWGENVELDLRTKWASQVKIAVEQLHRAGAVWGDAKSSNVLIDRENNAWITDFEGGYTDGWVDREKAGTVAGDLQGLYSILEQIFSERSQTPDSEGCTETPVSTLETRLQVFLDR